MLKCVKNPNSKLLPLQLYDLCPAKHRNGKKERGVNRLTVNTPKMHGTPHTHIKISIYILYYNKVRARGSIEKTAVNC